MLSLLHDGGNDSWFDRLKPFEFSVPDNLTIFTSQNTEGSLFEKQMAFHNCNDYKVLKPTFTKQEMDVILNESYQNFNNDLNYPNNMPDRPPWSNVFRLRYHLDFLKSSECKEYVLFCDANDVLFLDSPDYILSSFLNKFDCDLLYNGGHWACWHYWEGNQKSMRTRQYAQQRGNVHLNAGVYIGRKNYIIKIYENVLNYVTDDPEIRKAALNKDLDRPWEGPQFPLGSPSDQLILRYLQLDYFPQLQVDLKFKLMGRLTHADAYSRGILDLERFNSHVGSAWGLF
ncbi:hypothetical protein CMI37_22195 [Candidatus Pacearchaeota archaeon]|nr:hypothetical protein [Candidatus Pacearchaeota archaeon]|tara:strand:- start:17860 stop:18717 length:858 start_codon:yes stop_codon:yes gene_type:complete